MSIETFVLYPEGQEGPSRTALEEPSAAREHPVQCDRCGMHITALAGSATSRTQGS